MAGDNNLSEDQDIVDHKDEQGSVTDKGDGVPSETIIPISFREMGTIKGNSHSI